MPSMIPEHVDRQAILSLLEAAHCLTAETDTLAGRIADLVGLPRDSDTITDAIWNAPDAGSAMMFLEGEISTPNGVDP
ncbi:hypothetical protein [Roseovarius sp.]|uniref:hypothetical protein n=1 Tax=Roseovarius sp. TaxID=1486281 RepID=UPI003D1283DC